MQTDIGQKRIVAAQITEGISNQAIYRKVINLLVGKKLSGRILDFGAGVGNLVTELAALNRFISVFAIDLLPPPQSALSMAQWDQCDLNNETPYSSGQFDVVVSSEVIEHLENPRSVTREWYRILKPGGVLIFTTPNNESIRSYLALVLKGHYCSFADQSYPEHITALLRKDITRILQEAGFCDIQFSYTNEGGIPKLPIITWQKVSFGLLRGRLFSDNIVAFAVRPIGKSS